MRRPVFFNLIQIQMPVGAVTSITHRILSLQSPQSYARVTGLLERGAFKLVALVFIWALAHHIFAGIRHLLSDIDIGSRLSIARRSAWIVNIAGLIVALLAIGVLF
jgi:succinate dehydrogenase / fumarate reductase cytochrome b subunit